MLVFNTMDEQTKIDQYQICSDFGLPAHWYGTNIHYNMFFKFTKSRNGKYIRWVHCGEG